MKITKRCFFYTETSQSLSALHCSPSFINCCQCECHSWLQYKLVLVYTHLQVVFIPLPYGIPRHSFRTKSKQGTWWYSLVIIIKASNSSPFVVAYPISPISNQVVHHVWDVLGKAPHMYCVYSNKSLLQINTCLFYMPGLNCPEWIIVAGVRAEMVRPCKLFMLP